MSTIVKFTSERQIRNRLAVAYAKLIPMLHNEKRDTNLTDSECVELREIIGICQAAITMAARIEESA